MFRLNAIVFMACLAFTDFGSVPVVTKVMKAEQFVDLMRQKFSPDDRPIEKFEYDEKDFFGEDCVKKVTGSYGSGPSKQSLIFIKILCGDLGMNGFLENLKSRIEAEGMKLLMDDAAAIASYQEKMKRFITTYDGYFGVSTTLKPKNASINVQPTTEPKQMTQHHHEDFDLADHLYLLPLALCAFIAILIIAVLITSILACCCCCCRGQKDESKMGDDVA